MPAPIGLASDWIPKLLKLWTEIRQQRGQELDEINNAFGDPELLARSYIEPDCQRTNPADFHEDEPHRTFRQPIRKWLNGFLKGEFFERDGRNTLFVLSDAGMGKTSLLMMLKLTHLMSFWPKSVDFRLLKLGPKTLEDVGKIRERKTTVLLLDALDEDPTAWGRIEGRLEELLQATQAFRQVVVTGRTQFFPKSGKAPIETPEKVEVVGFVTNLLYLSPFDDEQVDSYLRKVYPNKLVDGVRKWFTKVDNEELERARKLVLPMRSLRMRPMLLSRIQDLMEADVHDWREFPVYEALVRSWLLREEREKPGQASKEELWEACTTVALHLQSKGKRELTETELKKLLAIEPVAEHIESLDVGGRSLMNRTGDGDFRFAHYSVQEFLVAHRLTVSEGPEVPAELQLTDQMETFLRSRLEQRTGIEFVSVPGGEYVLGADEHRVALSPFWIGKHPVTNEQYGRFLEANPEYRKPEYWDQRKFNQPQQPVVGVDWNDANAYCQWTGVELPSEAQWEAAARGTDGRRYPWGDDEPTSELANFDNKVGKPTPVGAYPTGAGPYGTLDQAGNVWEWCRDVWNDKAHEGRDGQRDPVQTVGEAGWRVLRGGSWASLAWILPAAFRFGHPAGLRNGFFGFRCLFRSGPST